MEKETIIKIAEELYQEAFDANAYFIIMKQYSVLYRKYKEEFQLSPAFYSMTYQAMQKACFMELAKIFDTSKDAISLGYLLQQSQENIELFPEFRGISTIISEGIQYSFPIYYQHHLKRKEECFFEDEVEFQRKVYKLFDLKSTDTTPVHVNLTFPQFLELYQKRFRSLSKKQDNIRKQRNKIYAHNDLERILDENSFLEKNPIYYQDIEEMIEFSCECIGLILGALTGKQRTTKYLNIDDLENTLNVVRLGLKYQEYDFQQQMENDEWE